LKIRIAFVGETPHWGLSSPSSFRKTTKTLASFPTDDAATKLIYLAIRNFESKGRCVREWVAARNQFAIL